ncbi:MAG: hypothetical protein HUU16_20695 [Candidatus Omnitrophica bacterium]|nr:hypothetical protein [Candidatus Omnitrophota bacterium]
MKTFFLRVLGHEAPPNAGATEVEPSDARLWGREIRWRETPRLAPVFQALGGFFSRPAVFGTSIVVGFVAYLWFGFLIRRGWITFIPHGPRSFWWKILGLWVCANLANLVRMGGAMSIKGEGRPCLIGWGSVWGVPVLRVRDTNLDLLPWKDALRVRLSGVAFLWAVATLVSVWVSVDAQKRLVEGALVVMATGYFTGLLQLSPWWRSPLRLSLEQASPGMGAPWCWWNHLWGGLWASLFANRSLTPQETFLASTTVYFLLWNLLIARSAAFVKRHLAVLLYIDSINAGEGGYGWLVFAAMVLTALGCIGVLLVFVVMIVTRAVAEIGRLFRGGSRAEASN